MSHIEAICRSERKGTRKSALPSVRLLEDYGLEGDAHAGAWHRQVSLLSLERIEAFRRKGALVSYGDFGENLVIAGLDLSALPVGARLISGDIVLEITQIGKECHTRCAIYEAMGECIMPSQGVFARVLRGGEARVGDPVLLKLEAAGL